MRTWLRTPRDGVCLPCGSEPCSGAGYDICELALSHDGGDEGFDQSYPSPRFTPAGGTLLVHFEALHIPDRLVLSDQAGAVLYDSGYIGTAILQPPEVDATVAVPAGTTTVRIQVTLHPDYNGTLWALEISCADPPP